MRTRTWLAGLVGVRILRIGIALETCLIYLACELIGMAFGAGCSNLSHGDCCERFLAHDKQI